MKVNKLGKLRYNIWFYFLLFTLILIAVLWVSQVLIYDYVYRQQKLGALKERGESVYTEYNTSAPVTQSMVNDWINDAVGYAEDGYSIYLAKYSAGSVIAMETVFGMSVATEAGGSNDFSPVEKAVVSAGIRSYLVQSSEYVCVKYDYSDQTSAGSDETFYIFCGKVSNQRFGDELYLVISTPQHSLKSTVAAMQLQLLIVTLLVIALSFFLSMYISHRLADPIIDMARTAKKWAGGDAQVTFKASGYEELSELADALNFAKEGIARTGQLQADLLANVSHDLKTPLTMIKAYAEMIRDISGEDKQKRDFHAGVIIDETDRLTMLVNDILDLSKLQNGINKLDLEKVDLSELCEGVIMKFSDFAEKDGFVIIKDIDEGLFVKADEQKISQVIYNLIGNAVNYTGEDKRIKVSLKKRDGKIVFEAIDTGKGISEDRINTIWEKYYRDSETHQRPIKGTGLGLSIVKTILESHNLRFGVITKTGVGSNFFIEFEEYTDD
ncbi:MAG: HAMP domain-containing histidine kinase [Clostridia bacterium]|nr:HAMP domain-containing histidine kinase [Clostridia bacterium]